MKTDETLKAHLIQHAEEEIQKLVEQLQTLKEGDLKELEQTILSSSLSIGKGMFEQVLTYAQVEQQEPTRRQGNCGHRQRLVGKRKKEVLTLMGPVVVHRRYYQCQMIKEEKERNTCTHGEAPFDQIWGIEERRTTPGVQKLVSFFAASMTLQEATDVFCSLFPLKMSTRQVLHLLQPVGEALGKQQDAAVKQILQTASEKHTSPTRSTELEEQVTIDRMYIEIDGVLARMRRGSMPMEKKEMEREGDIYREIKVGAIFEAAQGRERSQLAQGVFVDTPLAIKYVAQRTTAEAFGFYLYALAKACGIERAKQVVVLGDGARWIWNIAAEQFPQAIQIVDIWHAREHAWKVAHAVFGKGNLQGAKWARHACDLLTQGQIEMLVQIIEQLPAIALEPGAARSVPEIEADYFRSNAQRMRYPTFRATSACRSGVAWPKLPVKRSSRPVRSELACVGLLTGCAVLALRIAVLNKTYGPFWDRQSHLIA
jgi:hypothetical protein